MREPVLASRDGKTDCCSASVLGYANVPSEPWLWFVAFVLILCVHFAHTTSSRCASIGWVLVDLSC